LIGDLSIVARFDCIADVQFRLSGDRVLRHVWVPGPFAVLVSDPGEIITAIGGGATRLPLGKIVADGNDLPGCRSDYYVGALAGDGE
jgi:hypothetical protein